MNGRILAKYAAMMAIAGFVQGCTAALWEQGECRPALDPNVKLFQVGNKVLVQYSEAREEHDDLKRRNFFLEDNLNAIADECAPIFFEAKKTLLTNPIPLLLPSHTNSGSLPVYAVSEYDNGTPFFIVREGRKSGPYELPIYRDKTKGATMRRAMLTPLAATADAAVLVGIWQLHDLDEKQKEREERDSMPHADFQPPRKKK